MPNLHIPRTGGDFSVELINAAVTLEKGKPNSLLDADGSSLVIHATKDDYRTDPSGNSGGRIACGVIMEQSGTVGRTGK
jgi:Cu-Zn family superoxide dismutase